MLTHEEIIKVINHLEHYKRDLQEPADGDITSFSRIKIDLITKSINDLRRALANP